MEIERKSVHVGRSNSALLAQGDYADVSDWDDEELERGRRRDKNGNFTGRPPKVVPRAVFVEYVQRKTRRAELAMAESMEELVAVLADIAKDPNEDPELRVKVATWTLEHFIGKAPTNVSVQADVRHQIAPWERALESAIVTVGSEHEDVIDAEVVDDPSPYDPIIVWDQEGDE